MNCHKKNGQRNQDAHGGHGKHMLLMVLCCALPIVLLLLLPVLRINSPAIRNILPFAILLLCPLMHVAMIPMLFRKDKNKEQKPAVREIEE